MSEIKEPSLKSQELLDRVIDSFQIRMLWKDRDSRYIDCNQAFAEDAGFSSPSEVIGKTEFDMPWAEEEAVYHLQTDHAIMESGESILSFEQALRRSAGKKSWILTSKIPTRDDQNRVNGILVMYQDMTAIKELERSQHQVNRAYLLLRDTNNAVISSLNESELFTQICQLVVKHGYKMAWIGKLLHDEARRIEPVASAGFIKGYLDQIKVVWSDTPLGHGPTGTAARDGKVVVNQSFLTNPDMQPWREAAREQGFESSIALPLKTESGDVFAVLTIYASEPNAFDEDETSKLEELAQTLSFGHGAIHERTRRFDVLEKSVAALAATVESRDPYTAGHQSRVANLAQAIAEDLGLDSETCTGIRFAALIHDIGKIHIPAELLAKPTKLTDLEMTYIKIHPEEGYQIIKDIPFPWPVAEMVRQHHERMDGSGYPNGLKNDEILLGAQIIAVADIVESMSSHRPYRPARGLDAAFEEISRQRGAQLNSQVVDSCLRLFKEKNFSI